MSGENVQHGTLQAVVFRRSRQPESGVIGCGFFRCLASVSANTRPDVHRHDGYQGGYLVVMGFPGRGWKCWPGLLQWFVHLVARVSMRRMPPAMLGLSGVFLSPVVAGRDAMLRQVQFRLCDKPLDGIHGPTLHRRIAYLVLGVEHRHTNDGRFNYAVVNERI